MKYHALIYFFILVAYSTVAFSDGLRLNVVADEWPPFSTEFSADKGLSLAVIKMALQRAGYEVETNVIPYARALQGIERGTYDVIGSAFYDKKMEAFLHYSDSYYTTAIRVMRQRGSNVTYAQYEDFKQHSIAVGIGYQYSPRFDGDKTLRKVAVPTIWNCLQMLAAGRVDMALESVDVVRYLLNTPAGKELAGKIEFIGPPMGESNIYMGVSKTRADAHVIVDSFNAALATMRADGSYDRLLAQHIK